MNRKFSSSVILPLVGMMIILALAYGFDILIKTLKEQNAYYSLDDILLWTYAATNLLLNGALLLLFWRIMTKTTRSIWVGVIYLAVGMYLVISLGLYRFTGNFFYPPVPGSLLFYSMGGIGLIGLLLLILPRVTPNYTE
jgi:hypothetical protein